MKKIYKDINEWYHPEIDYHEMIENFRWTRDVLQEAIKRPYSFPLDHVMLMHHAKAWDFDPVSGKEYPSKQQMFQFWNKQFNDALAQVLEKTAPNRILDVCAGDGMLASILKKRGFDVIAVDNYSWDFSKRYYKVEKLSYTKALQKYQPDVVIGSWMPLGTDWTPDFRRTKSIKHYIQIGEVNACCGGNWDDRKTWPIQECEEASKYALCRTDSLWFSGLKDPNNIYSQHSEWMMHHSAVYLTSRRKFALTI